VFPNPATEKPYWQEEIQKKHIKPAAEAASLGTGIVWDTFRHTYRTLLDETGAPMKVQQELMRHASIQTTMNVYGQALSSTKRQANSKLFRWCSNRRFRCTPMKKEPTVQLPDHCIFSYWGFFGVSRFDPNSRKLMIPLVAGGRSVPTR
jgi:Phage integrase family